MKVILYSTGCPQCNALKKILDSKKISYEVHSDIAEMKGLGILSVPYLSVDGELKNFAESMAWVRQGGHETNEN